MSTYIRIQNTNMHAGRHEHMCMHARTHTHTHTRTHKEKCVRDHTPIVRISFTWGGGGGGGGGGRQLSPKML